MGQPVSFKFWCRTPGMAAMGYVMQGQFGADAPFVVGGIGASCDPFSWLTEFFYGGPLFCMGDMEIQILP